MEHNGVRCLDVSLETPITRQRARKPIFLPGQLIVEIVEQTYGGGARGIVALAAENNKWRAAVIYWLLQLLESWGDWGVVGAKLVSDPSRNQRIERLNPYPGNEIVVTERWGSYDPDGRDMQEYFLFDSVKQSRQMWAQVLYTVKPPGSLNLDESLALAVHNRMKDVNFFLAVGANPNSRGIDNGDTAIREYISIPKKDPEMLRAMLESGGDPNDSTEPTPLLLQAIKKPLNIARERVQILLDRGSRPNDVDETGRTALFGAVEYSNDNAEAIVRALLAADANVNHQTTAGETPLMQTARRGDVKMASVLLGSGANVDIKNASGTSALDIASSKGDISMLRLFENWPTSPTPIPGTTRT